MFNPCFYAMPLRILFVCYENICRSPMAEGVFRHLLQLRGLASCCEVQSAGTVCYQAGSSPDPRAVRAAGRHGVDISGIRARCIHDLDMNGYDLVFAMDHENHRDLLEWLDGVGMPELHLMTAFSASTAGDEIEDPYYGPEEGFDRTLRMLLECSEAILDGVLSGGPAGGLQDGASVPETGREDGGERY
jgi:protein-tyrosine phosphatase